jgi:phosphoglycerol transferase MdoB-like AlkP superfamily enzyme
VALTSIIPVAESVAYQFPSNEYVTPATVLRQKGYSTLASIPYRQSFWNRHLTHPAYGFADGLYVEDFERGSRVGWGLNDREFFRQIVPPLEAMPRPFVVWLTTLSLHYPYSKYPEALKSLSLGSLEGTALGNYLHGMHLFDQAFGELIESLRTGGLLDETVIALWGDHDSRLVTRKQSIPGIELAESWPEWYLQDRVPFMVWVPGEGGPRGARGLAAGQTDFAPTLLALMGFDPSVFAFLGRDLLSDPQPRPIVHPDGDWTDGRYLWINRREWPKESCWSLEKKRRVSRELCEPGIREALEQLEISDRLLLYDLQRRVSSRLQMRR